MEKQKNTGKSRFKLPNDLKNGLKPIKLQILGKIEVNVNQALIIRAHNKSRPENHSFGLQFTSISKEDLKSLRELIYDVQRKFIRKESKHLR